MNRYQNFKTVEGKQWIKEAGDDQYAFIKLRW